MDQINRQAVTQGNAGHDNPARTQEGYSSCKILLAFVALVGVYFLFSSAGGIAPAKIALGFVALWLVGAAVTLVLLSVSGKTRKSDKPGDVNVAQHPIETHHPVTKDLAA